MSNYPLKATILDMARTMGTQAKRHLIRELKDALGELERPAFVPVWERPRVLDEWDETTQVRFA